MADIRGAIFTQVHNTPSLKTSVSGNGYRRELAHNIDLADPVIVPAVLFGLTHAGSIDVAAATTTTAALFKLPQSLAATPATRTLLHCSGTVVIIVVYRSPIV